VSAAVFLKILMAITFTSLNPNVTYHTPILPFDFGTYVTTSYRGPKVDGFRACGFYLSEFKLFFFCGGFNFSFFAGVLTFLGEWFSKK
jgi:hypothetical protein